MEESLNKSDDNKIGVEEEELPITINAFASPKFSLAQQQNSVPIINELYIENNTDEKIEKIEIEVVSDPLFLTPKTWHIDSLSPARRFSLNDLNIDVSRKFLSQLTEAVKGTITVTAKFDDFITSKTLHIDVLAPDEWGGIGYLPELTSAFCLPNDPSISIILREVAEGLERAGLDVSLEGYQSKDRKRVWQLVSAIYNAICERKIVYTNPPASFEKIGQKVRSPSRIIQEGLGTCFDLALLFASCLEQIGLNPLILITKNHAFVGCWLINDDFSIAAQDDAQAVRKRVKLGEMILIETTFVTKRPTPSLSRATQAAYDHLENEDEFEYAIDIKRSRMNAIKPIAFDNSQAPQNTNELNSDFIVDSALHIEDAPILPDVEIITNDNKEVNSPNGRVERWKRRLLDLTLRNNLLNFKATKSTIPIFCNSSAQLEDLLASGSKLKFIPMPKLMVGDDPRSAELHKEKFSQDAKIQLADESSQKKELLSTLDEGELGNRLTTLFRKAKNDMEEGGANTLFLAIGFLNWKQADNSERTFKAPLLLLPVTITRKSVLGGFKLELLDDEPRINPTLLQLLRQDFEITVPQLEDELPEDHSGLDVPLIFNIFRQKIRDIKGWEITEEASISTFSFTKYLMWKDLEDRTALLKENPIVKHLIDTPKDSYPDQGPFPVASELDRLKSPRETYCPILADSSQLAAVFAAAEGKSFILEGPPGTGKSQTITNMIVQCLTEGQTVLFVSEKMAALDVVYRRLREVGMDDFCLELHSSKARKMDVLKQLGNAWDSSRKYNAEDWDKEALKLEKLREKLNLYPERLHRKYRNGLTPFEAMSSVIGGDEIQKIDISWPIFDHHTEEELESIREIVQKIQTNVTSLGNISESAFSEINIPNWSMSWQQEIEKSINNLKPKLDSLRIAFQAFLSSIKFENEITSKENITAFNELGVLLSKSFRQTLGFSCSNDCFDICDDIDKVCELGNQYQTLKLKLSSKYKKSATNINLNFLHSEWQRSNNSFWPMSAIIKNKVRKSLSTEIEYGQSISKTQIIHDLLLLIEMNEYEDNISTFSEKLSAVGKSWQGNETNWNELFEQKQLALQISGVCSRLAGSDLEKLVEFRNKIKLLLVEGNDLLAPSGAINSHSNELNITFNDFIKTSEELKNLATSEGSNTSIYIETGNWLENIDNLLRNWTNNLPKLRDWCAWQRVRNEAILTNLSPLIVGLENNEFPPSEISKVFETNYRRWWINLVGDADDVLREFSSIEHEKSIQDFKDLDQKIMQATPAYVRAKLSGNIPSKESIGTRGQTEWGILNRELNKKARHMPLRKLVDSLPNALTKLTPCLLMSPLSISQYLGAGKSQFDVVIFDEASQISVWDAVGAIARGKQAIIVGDPKQLPPTNFFGRNTDEEVDDDDIEDLESILDECLAANMPIKRLDRHYRSRHESLITFSNHHYYNGRLVTFPSAVTDDSAVKYHHVSDAVYERGAAVNPLEAKAVCEAVLDWLKNPEFIKNNWSIGVVTFNKKQQMLIEDLLDEARRSDPSLEVFFSSDRIEPVFVKNIENVQGDERDIILFSITFGPTKTRPVSMNFGALNKEGGERRLNVAITRARQALHVYGRLRSEDIDLSRTKAVGVRDFKHFLEFAEKGTRALAEAIDAPRGGYDSPFEEEVTLRLSNKGWDIHTQIGVSSYRVDLGVVHPDYPGRYLAGIECDGATYHSSANARERDRLREMVLRGLGWEIVRIWSTDWWINKADITEKVHNQLLALLEEDRNKPALEIATEVEENIIDDETEIAEDTDVPPAIDVEDSTHETDNTDNQFIAANLENLNIYLIPDDFHTYSETKNISTLIDCIVSIEAPVSLNVVAEKIARQYGFKRTTNKILSRVHRVANQFYSSSKEDDQTFLWTNETNPTDYQGMRMAAPNKGIARQVEHICILELSNIARFVKQIDCPIGDDELVRCIGDRLGYKRITEKVRNRILSAISEI